MSARRVSFVACGLALATLSWAATPARAGSFFRSGAVGGVYVDAQGVLHKAGENQVLKLRRVREEMLKELPQGLADASPLRKVSLRRLHEAIAERKRATTMPEVTEEMEYLGGLTGIQYILVYPEENDIVLVGPGEALKPTENGHLVGAQSGRPALQLDHLVVALRTAASARQQPISCSIDPTPEGIQALQRFLASQRTFTRRTAPGVEAAMGLQNITITGVSPESDFARTLVAADYQMKRLAMGLDRSPVRGLPSYLSMIKAGASGLQNATPRWWLAPNYEPLSRDPEGLAWELRGPGVRCLTEDSFVAETGAEPTGKSSKAASLWAERMTEHYGALSEHYPILGELKNLMDMAVVGALIVKEDLMGKAGLELPLLVEEDGVMTVADFPAPKKVQSVASVVKQGRKYIISASGGVEVASWAVVTKPSEENPEIAPLRKQSAFPGGHWWWN